MILGKVREIEVEYDEDNDALFLMKGDDTYEVNVIGIWDANEAKELIAFLSKFIEIKENKNEVIWKLNKTFTVLRGWIC